MENKTMGHVSNPADTHFSKFQIKAFRLLKETRSTLKFMECEQDTALLRVINEFLNDYGQYDGPDDFLGT